jgi:hypothetical protein
MRFLRFQPGSVETYRLKSTNMLERLNEEIAYPEDGASNPLAAFRR